MAKKRSWITGADAVLQWFEANADKPYFSVWRGRDILFSNNENDFEVAKKKLYDNIVAGEQNDVTEELQLRLHNAPAKGYIDNSSKYHSSIYFTPTEYEKLQPAPMYYKNDNHTNNAILEKLNGIESRIAAIEMDEEFEEVEEKPTGINGIIQTLLNNEQIQMAMIGAATHLLSKFMPSQKTVNGIAGIPEEQDEKIMGAIAVLKQHDPLLGDDLLKLAEMAENNNNQFNFLLSMLRK